MFTNQGILGYTKFSMSYALGRVLRKQFSDSQHSYEFFSKIFSLRKHLYLKANVLVFFPTSHFRIALALFDKERHAFHYLESYNCVMPQGVQISGMPKRPFEMLLSPKPSLIMAS